MFYTIEETHSLWEKFRPLWTSWAYKLRAVDYDKEDLYQESYFILLKALEHYDDQKGVPFESYYKIILYRWGKDYLNKKRGQVVGDTELMDYLEGDKEEIDFLKKLIYEEQAGVLTRALASLKPAEKDIILKFYFEEKSLKEIACEMGLTMRAVVGRKVRAIEKLAQFFGNSKGQDPIS